MTDTTEPTKLVWDFFGPHAERTATHFEKHLRQFLEANTCPELACGQESAEPGHQAVYCLAPSELVAPLKAALRPNRENP